MEIRSMLQGGRWRFVCRKLDYKSALLLAGGVSGKSSVLSLHFLSSFVKSAQDF